MNAINQTYWLLLAGALLVLIGIASSLVARRFGAPLLLVFLVIGMLAGQDGPGGIVFDDVTTAYRVGSLALALILFDGGLRTRLASFRGVLAPTLLLATVGVVVSATLTGMAAIWLFALKPIEGLLLGAVVASTDAAAVFFLLRAGGLQLRRRVGATLEIESSTNDPVAVLLTTLLAQYLSEPAGLGAGAIALELGAQFAIGSVVGIAGGISVVALLQRLNLSGGLPPLFVVASAVLLFGAAGAVGGSGFLAVYLAGLVVGNRPLPGFANVLSVNDTVTWLCQIVMFLVLGLLVNPSHLLTYALPAVGLAAFLMLVGRPLAVALCLAPFGYGKREITYVAWVGLRGAVGIFLASIPLLMRLPHAALYFNVAFVVVLISMLVQGWSLGVSARWLDVALPHRDREVRRVELDLPGQLELELVGYPVAPDCAILSGKTLPGWARLTLVVRGGATLAPEAVSALAGGDHAYLLAPPGRVYQLDWLFAPPEEAHEAEREAFGEFSFDANVSLGDIAGFYGLPVRTRDSGFTLAQHFQRQYEHTVQVGDRVRLGAVTLIARELDDDGVTKVGLKLTGVGGALAGRAMRRHSRIAAALARLLAGRERK